MFILKYLLYFILAFSYFPLRAEQSLEQRLSDQKEALFNDYRYIVEKAYEAQGMNLQSLSGDLSVDDFLKKKYNEAFYSLSESLRNYELKNWKIGGGIRSLKMPWQGPLSSLVESMQKEQDPEKYEKQSRSFEERQSGRELSFLLENMEKYSQQSSEAKGKSNFIVDAFKHYLNPGVFEKTKLSFLEKDYFDYFHEIENELRQDYKSLTDFIHKNTKPEIIIFSFLAPMYHISFRQAGDAYFEGFILSLLVLEKSPFFDISRKNFTARGNTFFNHLVEAFFSPYADEKQAREAFLSIRAFIYFLNKHHNKSYNNLNSEKKTALMEAASLMEVSFKKDPNNTDNLQKYKTRFKQLFELMLEERGLNPSYKEINYVARKNPFLINIIFDSLEKHSRFKHFLFKFESNFLLKLNATVRSLTESSFLRNRFFKVRK